MNAAIPPEARQQSGALYWHGAPVRWGFNNCIADSSSRIFTVLYQHLFSLDLNGWLSVEWLTFTYRIGANSKQNKPNWLSQLLLFAVKMHWLCTSAHHSSLRCLIGPFSSVTDYLPLLCLCTAGVCDASGSGGLWGECGDLPLCTDAHSHCSIRGTPWVSAMAPAGRCRCQQTGKMCTLHTGLHTYLQLEGSEGVTV